jgi:hypothetical protein
MCEACKRLPDNSEYSREWTGNDRVNQHYHGRVSLNESPLKMRLNWKEKDGSPIKCIGVYEFDLDCLLKNGHIRPDHGEVRLRFQRTGPDIQIAVNRNERAPIKIGEFRSDLLSLVSS